MNKIDEFIRKYGRLGDAVITKISYNYENESTISIKMKCFVNHLEDVEWSELHIVLSGIKEFVFNEKKGKKENNVIYSAIIDTYDKSIVFDFSPYSPDANTMEEYRKSDFLVICDSFTYN